MMNRRKVQTVLAYPLRKFGTCMFAVTNRCNARCEFCSIPLQPYNGATSPNLFEQAIDKLYDLGVRYIQFTGGEPLLYPYLIRVIKHASELGMLMTVVTNGSLLDEKRAKALAESGVQGASISVDHYDSSVFERNRGIPGLTDRVAEGVQHLRDNGLPVQASTTISKLLDLEAGDYLKLV
ncbi:MAG: radical SAM protein, partial [Chloroflexi bacterium]|nr:radical SAM protein [Chloroflexota bacterium]